MDPRRLLPVLAATAGAFVVATMLAVTRPVGPPPGDGATVRASSDATVGRGAVRSPAREVLARWDDARADAWASGDAAALGSLYLPGSATGAADVQALRAWHRRGLHVEGMRTQVLRLEVAHRSGRRLVLVVTDRVVGGRAVGRGAARALPVGRAATRRVTLVRADGGWRVADAAPVVPRGQRRPAASTSTTSSSSKS